MTRTHGFFHRIAVTVGTILLCACLPAHAQNAAIVNGRKIPLSLADTLRHQMEDDGQADSPELRQQIREVLLQRELLVQEANQLGLGLKPEIRDQITLVQQEILIKALQEQFAASHPIDAKTLQAEYQRYVEQVSNEREFHVRHILLDDEESARKVLAKLNAGARFDELASKRSRDPGSARRGGDLDWMRLSEMEKPFAAAVANMKKGERSRSPVKTKFGFHIIQIDDTRNRKPKSFAEISARLEQKLAQQAWDAHVAQLRQKARIE